MSRQLMEYACRASLRLRYLYYANAKCATSSVLTTLLRAEKELGLHPHYPEDGLNRRQYRYTTNHLSVYTRQQNFFGFTFVRNPYTRILSAYVDKMLNREDSTYRTMFSACPWLEEDLSFHTFLQCLDRMHPEEMDPHWRPQVYNILYGQVSCDHFGHVEDMGEDLERICRKVFGHDVNVVRISRHSVKAVSLVKKYYGEEEIRLVRRIYADDFRLLGYVEDLDRCMEVPNRKPVSGFNGMNADLFAEAWLAHDSGLYEQSLERLAVLGARLPRNPFLHALAAMNYAGLGDRKRCLERVSLAVDLAPGHSGLKSLRNKLASTRTESQSIRSMVLDRIRRVFGSS